MKYDNERLVQLLGAHVDTNFRIRALMEYVDLAIAREEAFDEEALQLIIQTSFWAGVEAVFTDDDFNAAVVDIVKGLENHEP